MQPAKATTPYMHSIHQIKYQKNSKQYQKMRHVINTFASSKNIKTL